MPRCHAGMLPHFFRDDWAFHLWLRFTVWTSSTVAFRTGLPPPGAGELPCAYTEVRPRLFASAKKSGNCCATERARQSGLKSSITVPTPGAFARMAFTQMALTQIALTQIALTQIALTQIVLTQIV